MVRNQNIVRGPSELDRKLLAISQKNWHRSGRRRIAFIFMAANRTAAVNPAFVAGIVIHEALRLQDMLDS